MQVRTAFGLDVRASEPLLLLEGATAAATGRELQLTVAPTEDTEPAWPPASEIVCDQREPDGSISFRIEADSVAGYMIWGPSYGRHLLSPDGNAAHCAPQGHATAAWQRLLIAQVLPFAAVLRGLEVWHASAVVYGSGAIALLGPSRAGKTSLALALCEHGATFLADDVLAVERVGEELLGHPGSPIAGLDHDEAERRAHTGSVVGATIATNERERLVSVRAARRPAPLEVLLLLERVHDGPTEPRFEPLAGGARLLGGTFNSVLTTPERLRRLLEISALAAQRRVERVVLGPAVDASLLAEAVLDRFGGRA